MTPPTPGDIAAAAHRLHGHIVRTPTIRNPLLDEITGGTVLLKAECLQRTGSFKLRGATNAALQLSDAERRAGVVTYSSGNHGQAIACAAAGLGMHATVFMPDDAPEVKVASTRRWGAEIIRFNRRTDNREEVALAYAARTGAAVVPPYEHPHVIAGQGTLALELIEDAGARTSMPCWSAPAAAAWPPAAPWLWKVHRPAPRSGPWSRRSPTTPCAPCDPAPGRATRPAARAFATPCCPPCPGS